MGYAPALTTAPRQATAAPARTLSARTPGPAPCGNQALLRRLQAKLKVGSVDDPLEHEADRVADQVMRMPAPGAALTSAPPQVSRKCAACEEHLSRKCAACEEEEKLQKKEAGPQAAVGEAPASVHEALRSPGQPLDAATRAYFEPRFGRDFSWRASAFRPDGRAIGAGRECPCLYRGPQHRVRLGEVRAGIAGGAAVDCP